MSDQEENVSSEEIRSRIDSLHQASNHLLRRRAELLNAWNPEMAEQQGLELLALRD